MFKSCGIFNAHDLNFSKKKKIFKCRLGEGGRKEEEEGK